MAKVPLSVSAILVSAAYGSDDFIGPNVNTDPSDKVQAFVDCFAGAAAAVSAKCFGLPAKFILAQWGAESGWGANTAVQQNQNWGCLKAGAFATAKGKGANGYTAFYGRKTFCDAYVHILKNVSTYQNLISYLRSTNQPSVERCIALIAASDYSETNPQTYAKLLTDCVASIDKRTNFSAK